jgi:hypothetical protein
MNNLGPCIEENENDNGYDPPEVLGCHDLVTLSINAAPATSKPKLRPGESRRLMGNYSKAFINLTQLEYSASCHKASSRKLFLLADRGSNGDVAGADV